MVTKRDLKPWHLMTEKDIEAIVRKKCSRCKFRGGYGEGNCSYILVTGHMRGCRPEACTRFEAGRRIKVLAAPDRTKTLYTEEGPVSGHLLASIDERKTSPGETVNNTDNEQING